MASGNVSSAVPGTVMQYWQWLCRLDKSANPAYDNDGDKDVEANKSNPLSDEYVFLSFALTGSSQRICNIPYGKKVLVPSLSCIASYPKVSDKQLSKLLDTDQDYIEYRRISIDGKPLVGNLDRFRVRTDFFDVEYPQNAIFNSPQGSYQGIADGVYVVWEPKERGEHIIHFEGRIGVPENEESIEYREYSEDVTYTLIVK